jgi:hypothetical protein
MENILCLGSDRFGWVRNGSEFNAKTQSGQPQTKPGFAAKEDKAHKELNRGICGKGSVRNSKAEPLLDISGRTKERQNHGGGPNRGPEQWSETVWENKFNLVDACGRLWSLVGTCEIGPGSGVERKTFPVCTLVRDGSRTRRRLRKRQRHTWMG